MSPLVLVVDDEPSISWGLSRLASAMGHTSESAASAEQGLALAVYVWGYRVVISNNSGVAVRLVNRYWNITDQNGQIDEVSGPGVVGEQPRLQPGDTYEYSSGCPLDTPSGIMFGHYKMEDDNGDMFEVDIPAFSLDSPGLMRTLN